MKLRSATCLPHAISLLVCLAALLSLPPGALSATSRALPGITEFDSLLVSRADPSKIFLGTGHGLFESLDGGRSWRPAGLAGDAVTSLAQTGGVILAAGHGLLASSIDGGRTWRRIHPRGLPNENIDALATDSGRIGTVDVVIKPFGLFRSTDSARSFNPLSLAVGPAIRAMALTSKHILLGDVVSGVYVGSNGRVWSHTAGGMVMSLAVNPGNQEHMLAASYGVALSRDGGRFWTTMMHSSTAFGAVAWAPSRPSLAYAISDNGSFWRSTDGAVDWMRVATA